LVFPLLEIVSQTCETAPAGHHPTIILGELT
jgi:hypothetical protein